MGNSRVFRLSSLLESTFFSLGFPSEKSSWPLNHTLARSSHEVKVTVNPLLDCNCEAVSEKSRVNHALFSSWAIDVLVISLIKPRASRKSRSQTKGARPVPQPEAESPGMV